MGNALRALLLSLIVDNCFYHVAQIEEGVVKSNFIPVTEFPFLHFIFTVS